MISSEVQRTLVKSPPELWAELSDPEALTRHLGALGEIRITRAEPEKLVEWEAEGTSGVVQIKSSGWGTKVTLSVTREVKLAESFELDDPAVNGEPDAEDAASEPSAQDPPPAEPDPIVPAEPEAASELVEEAAPDVPAKADGEHEGEASTEPVQQREAQATEPRRGFFARLFGRRRARAAQLDIPSAPEVGVPEASTAAEPAAAPASSAIELLQARFAPTEPEPVLEAPAPTAEPAAEPPETVSEPEMAALEVPADDEAAGEIAEEPVDLAAELKAAEEVAAAEVTAVLTAALDRLGAAHHRPFSRS
jgi:hypothetical protein